MSLVIVLLLAALAAVLLRRWTPPVRATLDAPWLPVAVGIAWSLLALASWGSLQPMPLDHDEIAYLMQSEIFASGRWAAPAPPIAEFFGQAHVLVSPVLASKYPPGHSLLLALGTLLGAPALVVSALNAVRVGLLFALARRAAGGPAALLACALLFLSPGQARFSSSYYSQLTTGALLLAAWYCLWRWRDERRLAWLLGVAGALGWCAITRPWSAVAFAVPIAVVVLRDVWRTRAWRELGLALALGTCIVAILPLWSRATTGDWRRTPLLEYARDYMPFDYPHFGATEARPRREVPPDVASINASLLQVERAHTATHLPADAVERVRWYARDLWSGPALPLAALVLVGLAVLPRVAWLAVATAATQFAAYLLHPTWPQWTVYYFEMTPVVLFVAALGIATVLGWLVGERRGWRAEPSGARESLATLALVVMMLPLVVITSRQVRTGLRASTAERRRFEAQLTQLPHTPAIVFVRHGPRHSPHRSLVVNRADWPSAPVWVVYDRGLDDARLAALAPGRQPYVYDEENDRFVEIRR